VPRVVPVDPSAPEPSVISEAAAALRGGGLVAFPTETVYGLGARGLHADEVRRIFTAKGRPSGHPLILHVDGEAMARSLASTWSELASRLVAELWPGPLTIVVPRAPVVPPEVSGGLSSVGIRAPIHPVARALVRAVGEPLAAPSANAHTHVSPTTAEHVVRSLDDRVDLVLDGGPCAFGIESTVLSLVDDPPRVLRPGAVSLERLRAIEPRVVHEAVTIEGEAARAAPGMAAKHYAPRAAVVLAERGDAGVAAAIADRAARGATVAAIVATPGARAAAAGCARLIAMPEEPEAYARRLFAALHEAEAAGADVVVVERVPDEPSWWAVADRLARAAR
jgi:L-threonylcarbamoyladenylate synthase